MAAHSSQPETDEDCAEGYAPGVELGPRQFSLRGLLGVITGIAIFLAITRDQLEFSLIVSLMVGGVLLGFAMPVAGRWRTRPDESPDTYIAVAGSVAVLSFFLAFFSFYYPLTAWGVWRGEHFPLAGGVSAGLGAMLFVVTTFLRATRVR